MDIETAKKLNEVLIPLGYTVGKIEYELFLFDGAKRIANKMHKYQEALDIETEKLEICADGANKIEFSNLKFENVLEKYGIKFPY